MTPVMVQVTVGAALWAATVAVLAAVGVVADRVGRRRRRG